MKKFLQTIAAIPVLAGFAVAMALFALVPRRKAYPAGAAFGRFLYRFFPKRRRIAVDNILKAGVAADPAEADRIARVSFGHLAGHVCEALKVPSVVNASNWREHLDVEGASPVAVRLLLEETDKPIILVSAHHGVWEAATNLLSFARPMIAIARTMNNPVAAKWMEKHHFRGPVTIIDKNRGFTPEIIRKWKSEKAAMTILSDQHAPEKRGVKVDFMGRPAWTFTTAVRLAAKTGCPIVVGSFVRTAPFRYKLVGGDPVTFPPDISMEEGAKVLNKRLGDAIRAWPEQYLWSHRRWR